LPEKIDLAKLKIQPLDPAMDRAAFYCGEPELDDFFRDNAADHHEQYLTRVYTALHDGEIVGYYWLNAQSHSSRTISEEALAKLERIPFAPCIYLGMIATLKRLHGNRIGRALMAHAFGQTLLVAEHVGVYALTLEAIDEAKAATYEHWGFRRFVEGELLMYIPLATIRAARDGTANRPIAP
jgi:GNAT superfamily N-acetyltransferase